MGQFFPFTPVSYGYGTSSTTAASLVATEGTLKLSGLDSGTDFLSETKAPEGNYLLPGGAAAYKRIVVDDANTLADLDGVVSGNDVTDTGYAFCSYPNTQNGSFSLPTTGGAGTMLITAAGVGIMGVAAVFLSRALKKRG